MSSHLSLALCYKLGWQQTNDIMHGSNANPCVASHSRVHGIIGQARAVDVVVGSYRNRTDDVGWVYVKASASGGLEVSIQLVLQHKLSLSYARLYK